MKLVYHLTLEQLNTHLQTTIATHACYQLVFENAERRKFKIHFPKKGIVIQGTAVPGENSTELELNATSPFCVISDAYEQRLLTTLIDQLLLSIHSNEPTYPHR